MVVSWMLLATTGILFSRYYKYLFFSKVICWNRFWLTAHRGLMVLSVIIAIIAFIIILACKWSLYIYIYIQFCDKNIKFYGF